MITAVALLCVSIDSQLTCQTFYQPAFLEDENQCVQSIAAFLNRPDMMMRIQAGWTLVDYHCIDWLEKYEGDQI